MGFYFLVGMLSAMAAAAQAQSGMAERLSKRLDVPFVTVSPGGQRMAAALTLGMENQLFIFDANTLEAIAFKFRLKAVDQVAWNGDNRLLAVAQDAMDVKQIFEVDLVADKARQLTKFRREANADSTSIHIFPPFSHFVSTVQFTRSIYQAGKTLYQLDVPDARVTEMRYLAHPSDTALPIRQSSNSLLEIWGGNKFALRFSNSPAAAPALHEGSPWDPAHMHALALTPDRKEVYVRIYEHGLQVVRRWNVTTRQLGPILHADSRYDVDAKPIVLPYSGDIIGVEYERDRPAVHYFDREFEKLMERLAPHFIGRHYVIASASADNDKLVILARSDTQPGEYFLFTRSQNTLKSFISTAEWLVEAELSKMRPISYVARDGVKIEGYLTEPLHPAQGKPLIVYPHGGPNVRDHWTFNPWVQYFASQGYAVIQPNYRVSTGYGAEFAGKGLRETGYKIQDDIADALQWAQGQGYGTGGKACIAGGSYGAYAAVRAATSDPDAFRCVIAIAGFYDVRSFLKDDENKPFYPMMKYLYGDPAVDETRLAAASALTGVERLTAPVMVVHGELDERVSVAHARQLIAELNAHHKVVEPIIVPGEGHSFHKASDRRRVMEAAGTFLGRYLRADR